MENTHRLELDRLVRRQRGRLVADLVRRLGHQNFALAEDVAQDALVKAMSNWPYHGVPDNPQAWLARVARNAAYDQLRRQARQTHLQDEQAGENNEEKVLFLTQVEDTELRLILLCCHESLSELERLTLTLKLAGGFSTTEIAEVFLAAESAVGQRMARAKRKLKAVGHQLEQVPFKQGIERRLPSVLKVIYLMFAMGYAPRSGDSWVRRDIASEAVRLSEEVAANEILGKPESHALAALLNFQSSRLDARETDSGSVILMSEQDRRQWDQARIRRGMQHLKIARESDELSRYHVEAAIAGAHVSGETDWIQVESLYGVLQRMVDSPVVRVNAAVAVAMAGDPQRALDELNALAEIKPLRTYGPYHIARAEVLRLLDREPDARKSYETALNCLVPEPVSRHIEERLISCL